MNKNANIRYFVEGEDERKFVNTLKNDLKAIIPGKVQILNVIQNIISDMIIRTFKPGTIVVLIFDTDTGNADILKKNIAKLNGYCNVARVITIPQIKNFEDELIYSCNIDKITDLLNSRSVSNFKSDLIHITNLPKKLNEHKFDFDKFWSRIAESPYQDIKNESTKIKRCRK